MTITTSISTTRLTYEAAVARAYALGYRGTYLEMVARDTVGMTEEEISARTQDYAEMFTARFTHSTLVGIDQDANATLLLSAPELLAAAQNALNVLAGIVVGDLKSIRADSPAIAELRAAIAKATGI